MMFNEHKTAQMAAFFLSHAPARRLPHLKLMKLLYLSDREAVRQLGLPISGDRLVSMPHGPVLSMTLDLMGGDIESQPGGWEEWVSDKEDHEVSLRKPATRDALNELSAAELDILDTIWNRFGGMGKWEIRDWTHKNCPEWEDPHGSSNPISHESLARAVGYDTETARTIAARIAAEREVDRQFAEM